MSDSSSCLVIDAIRHFKALLDDLKWLWGWGRGEIPFHFDRTKPHMLFIRLFFCCPGILNWRIRIQRWVQRRKTWSSWLQNFGSSTQSSSHVCNFWARQSHVDSWLSSFCTSLSLPSSYCVYLRVKQASTACKLKLWSAHLVRERLVCAECQSDAMSKSDRCAGDGLENTRQGLKSKKTYRRSASLPGRLWTISAVSLSKNTSNRAPFENYTSKKFSLWYL